MPGLSARLALQYRSKQARLSAEFMRQVMKLWRDLADPARIDGSWSAIRPAFVPLVLMARLGSAQLARSYYMQARSAAGVGDDGFMPSSAPLLSGDRLIKTLDVTGPVEFKKAISAGRTPIQAIEVAAVRMAGSTQYLVLEGGRTAMQDSIDRDAEATGWARVTDNDPCAWCAMLASRGPVYKSAKTAGDPRQGGNSYHDACACQAWPSFSLEEPFIGVAERLYDDWRRETRGTGGKNAVNAFRRWWEAEGRAVYAAPGRPSP